jgi:uncharacterized protein YggE
MALAALLVSPSLASAQSVRDGKLKVVGRGTIEIVPDYVSIRVGVSVRAANPTAALDQNSAAVRRIIEFAKKFGVEETNIQTNSVNLNPATKNVREPSGGTRQEPDGYSAVNSVRVKLADVSRMGTFMRQVLDQGATNIGGVEFGSMDAEKYRDEARADAVRDAIRQAQLLAEAAKIKLGSIYEIVYPPRSDFRGGDGLADMRVRYVRPGSMRVPLEAGTMQITAEVDVTWLIE